MNAREEHFAPGTTQRVGVQRATGRFASDPNKAIFVVALMENDNGNSEVLRGIVKGIVASSIAGSVGTGNRSIIVQNLIQDINSVLRDPSSIGLNLDDPIGPPLELTFSSSGTGAAEAGQLVSKGLRMQGDGGDYTLTFEAVKSFPVIGAIRGKWAALGRSLGRFSFQSTANYLHSTEPGVPQIFRAVSCLGTPKPAPMAYGG